MHSKTRTYPYVLSLCLGCLLFTCSGEGAGAQEQHQSPAPAMNVTGQRNIEAGTEWIQKRYDRITRMRAAGQLRCDTLRYACPEAAQRGLFVACYVEEELVIAEHERGPDDHPTLYERYYYDGTELYLAHLTERAGEAANSTAGIDHPIDAIHEAYLYYENGNLIDRLYKDYTLTSETVPPVTDQVPNQRIGRGVRGGLGSEVVRETILGDTVPCE
ncbi:hypothetical protein CLV84_3560 [Neolewinella xylanilytica]|uniref:Lipoprotein n=1 Tax=Neolewinella xylanilytica TaxID=1514080 RepID=A0A2S6I655_9BACT|nr:hypothetical protein [Neolewinella xylanilytica]PPK86625.1 hypothetical protein CLV84_3560 [Neolewinella xylanilytica]